MSVNNDKIIKANVCFDSMQDSKKRQTERVWFCVVIVFIFWNKFSLCKLHCLEFWSLEFLNSKVWTGFTLLESSCMDSWVLGIQASTIMLSLNLWGFLLLSFLYFYFLILILKIVSAHIEDHPTCHNYLCSCFPS